MRGRLKIFFLTLCGWLAPTIPAHAAEWRPALYAVGAWRFFNDEVALQSEWGYGARFGLTSDTPFSFHIDYVECKTWRKNTMASSDVMALRALMRVDVIQKTWRPYVIGGLGGLLLQFADAPNAGVGTMTLGLGVERPFAERWRAFAEASVDHYYYQPVFYDATGRPFATGQRTANVIGTTSIGFGIAF
jgi:hypothetical protein